MNKVKIGDLILIGVILVMAVGIFDYYQSRRLLNRAEQVIIEVDGRVVKTFDLPQDEKIEYKVIIDQDNYNLVEIYKDRVRVREATCPDQVDVRAGWISKPGQSLICLPHRLIVTISGSEGQEIDGKTY